MTSYVVTSLLLILFLSKHLVVSRGTVGHCQCNFSQVEAYDVRTGGLGHSAGLRQQTWGSMKISRRNPCSPFLVSVIA